MEINRDIYNKLNEWKDRKTHRAPLLVRGARQVGKSYAIRKWANANFGNNFIEINFEQNEKFKAVFDEDITPENILLKLQLITNREINKNNFLIFFDEIQACPQAIKSLRFFYEQMPEIYIIGAGSLLDFILEDISFPVGRVESIYMFPCTFYEFLEANGKKILKDYLINHTLNEQVEETAHKLALDELKLYYTVGGMPQVVSSFCDNKNLKEVSRLQKNLLQAYIDDFSKYSKENVWNILNQVFNNIPELVAGDRVKFSSLSGDTRSDKVRQILSLLEKANLIHLVRVSNSSKLPITSDMLRDRFKLLFLDMGLWQAALNYDWTEFDFNADLTDVYNGKFAEQFVGEELIAKRSDFKKYSLHYWERSQKNSLAEVDYLIEHKNKVYPIEVKSAVSGRLKSLHLYLDENNVNDAIVFSQRNIEIIEDKVKNKRIKFIPLYMVGNKNI